SPPPLISPPFPYTTLFRSHGHLDDADLGVLLAAADRQRYAQLGVVAALGGHRTAFAAADGREDVLRRGLAHGAGDGDEARRAPRSEEHTSELQSRFDLVCR